MKTSLQNILVTEWGPTWLHSCCLLTEIWNLRSHYEINNIPQWTIDSDYFDETCTCTHQFYHMLPEMCSALCWKINKWMV